MYNLKVETVNGIKYETVYNVDDFPYNDFIFSEKVKNRKIEYYNLCCSFDIETTTIKTQQNNKGKFISPPYGFMYQWQFAIEDKCVFGRTFEEFQKLLNNLKYYLGLGEGLNLVIYCHNLSFEFQFIKDFVEINSIFAKKGRKVMKFTCNNAFEFRCSYFLSNMSLLKFCENSKMCIHYKLADAYNYSMIRTFKTELTEEEKAYCYNDVVGLNECIKSMLIDNNDNIASIPLTNTGYVRRDCRNAMKANKKNYGLFRNMRMSVEEYEMCKKAFRGGNTHASRFYVNMILKNVKSYDITSSYPYVMMCESEFPISKWTKVNINSQDKLNFYLKNYCMIMEVHFKNIQTDAPMPYIPISKCEKFKNVLNDNGRVLKADYIKMTITNIDLEIIREMYDYDFFTISKAYYAKKGKLPVELRKCILEYYDKKTKLKGIDNMEYEYLKSKNRLNSLFGMMVTDILNEEWFYNQNEHKWNSELPDKKSTLNRYYDNKNSFLSYQWGIFVTALARKNLQTMINKVGDNIIYVDTDSIKFLDETGEIENEFNKINSEIIKKVKDNDIRAYSERDGIIYYLGVWDKEKTSLKFKTLGAKKYAKVYMKEIDNVSRETFEITVAGMNKKLGAKAVGCIENFNIGEKWDNCGRTTSWYNECEPHKITVNGDTFTTASNIGVLETTYEMGVTNEYWDIIQAFSNYNYKVPYDNYVE